MDIIKTQLKFVQREYLTETVLLSEFTVDQNIKFKPGEFANLLVAENTWRSYSFYDLKGKDVKFLVDTKPGGPGSNFFTDVGPGELVDALMPMGGFHVNNSNKPKIFVATGVGIAPFYSMIKESILKHSAEHIYLLWGVRYDEDFYLDKIFGELVEESRLKIIPCITKGGGNIPESKVERVTSVLPKLEIQFKDYELYICGNPDMVAEVIQIGMNLGIKDIFSEKY